MRPHEQRRCPMCNHVMHVMEGSDKTVRNKVYFKFRCRCCGHIEMDWYEHSSKGPSRLNNH